LKSNLAENKERNDKFQFTQYIDNRYIKFFAMSINMPLTGVINASILFSIGSNRLSPQRIF
jgi:hypothetical protein